MRTRIFLPILLLIVSANVLWVTWVSSPASANPSGVSFEPAVHYAAGTLPFGVGVGDLDNDTDQDLAVVNHDSNDVSVLLNNGDGTFGAAVNHPIGGFSTSIVAGDLDGDSDLDLAMVTQAPNKVAVLLNNGNGTFAAVVNHATGGPRQGAIGDLDGDNDLDLAVSIISSGAVAVLLNNGNATFTHVNYPVGNEPGSVVARDLDGDGDVDLAVTKRGPPETDSTVAVLLNNGNGTFAVAVDYTVGSFPSHPGAIPVTGGDLDGDGDVDLAVSHENFDNVLVLLNNGNATFSAAVSYGVGDGPHSVTTGDLDSDGDLDLATANRVSGTVSVLDNNGDGTFAAAVDIAVGFDTKYVTSGDLNGDGRLDLVTANFTSLGVSVLLNNTDNEGPTTTAVVVLPNPVAVNTAIDLTANVNDSTTGGSNIALAEFSIDGDAFATMLAQDTAFDEVTEAVEANISAFTDAGVHDICVRGTDEAGNIGAEECILLAVYNPDGGFVTGGGWIQSPLDACPIFCGGATGKANFGFVSKYKNGANTPSGNTEFQFKAGILNFHSSSYDWLVIAGQDKAKYKGEGTINGSGNHGFMLTAVDNADSGNLDTFRIKIWDKNAGDGVVYDNKMGANDDGYDGTEIGGGNIKVHEGK